MNFGQTLRLQGVVPVIPTPFGADESIDLGGIAACIEFAVRCGVGAVCLPAYGSEFYKLTEAERREVVETAIRSSAGRVAILAQSNHPSARCAADLARRNADLGADVISFAIPRQFALPAADLLDYCRTVCRAVSLPVLIQDFHPGGATVGADFARALHADCPNFLYLKLEEPLMAGKVRAIREATNDQVGVLEGWGGMYLLDLIPAGICGLMPGLGPADLLQRIWELGTSNHMEDALDLFEHVLPQLVYSLQSMELFLCLEKRLLVQRGVLNESNRHVRRPTWTPDDPMLAYGDLLNRRVQAAAESSTLAVGGSHGR